MLCLSSDHLEEPRPEVTGGHDQFSIQPLPGKPRQRVEQVAQVCAERGTAREQSDVSVNARSLRIVVATSDVSVSPDSIAFLSHDERSLRVSLQSSEAVSHVHAEILQRACERDVVRFIEPGL